ncbi:MAG: hypothetical protein HYV09_37705 [Deltaproteobacteria bacterium]|nr:hypothetical protein [Deltaproteobacteria bacterium]
MKKLTSLRLLGAIAIAFATAATSAGCMMHGHASASASAMPVEFASRPTLVAIGGGVWVVRASAHATYYVGDSYWVVREGVWYRSTTWDGGWVVVEANLVPRVIVTRNHTAYVLYQGSASAQTMDAPEPARPEIVASKDPPSGKGDDLPGVGNKRKEAGEQPGTVGKGLGKDEPKGAEPPKKEAKAEDKADKQEAKADKKEPKAEKKADKGEKKK